MWIMGPLNQNPRLQSAPPTPIQPLHLLRPPAQKRKHKAQAFLLIMNHPGGMPRARGSWGPESDLEVAGKLGPLIKGPRLFPERPHPAWVLWTKK